MMDWAQMENKSIQSQNSLSTRTKEKWVLVTQSCPTLCDPMDCSPPGSSVHGILQARILELAAMPFSRGSSQSRDWTQVSFIAGGFFTTWATKKAPNTWKIHADIVFWHRYVLAFSKRGAIWVPSKHFSCDWRGKVVCLCWVNHHKHCYPRTRDPNENGHSVWSSPPFISHYQIH